VLDILATAVGTAVSRAILRAWLKDESFALDMSTDLVEALGERVPGFVARRRLARQIEGIADEVAERLEPFFTVEYPGGLNDNERRAAAQAIGDTLAAGLSTAALISADLDPSTLESDFRRRDPERATRVLLAPAGRHLYDVALRECCSYIVEIAVELPDFALRSTQELLKRDRAILDVVQQVLTRLARAEAQQLAHEGESAQWEVLYRRQVSRRFGHLQLFGLDLAPANRRYALEMAYVTLDVSFARWDGEVLYEDEDEGERDRIDVAVAPVSGALVRGEAGSGKTTFLQWLAVTSADRRFEEALEDWNDKVPFVVQLRGAHGPLPRPERWLDAVAPALAGSMPPKYVHQKLDSGEALVLVDGVDELPSERRDDVREWLEDLRAAYPFAIYVVTSRPAAAEEGWLSDLGFDHFLLEPMAPVAVHTFVDQWHDAARQQEGPEDDEDELDVLSQRLRRRLHADPALMDIAATPLLCAMLCALNRDRRAYLPSERAELYSVALDMLLKHRDRERGVPDEIEIGLAEKRLLLQDLAHWLALNSRLEVPTSIAASRLRKALPALPRVRASAERVLEHLVERSGLLQQPTPDSITFIHRSFQEYLTALHLVEQDGIGFLIAHAHQDAWRDITVLTAGAAPVHQALELIRGLVSRGDAEPNFRHVLHLLAAACADLTPSVDANLLENVAERLEILVPPSTLSDANALASAGVLAVPLLEYDSQRTGRTNQACVRALARIGGEQAEQTLAAYAADRRGAVRQELLSAWSAFDPTSYATTVLAKMRLPRGKLSVSDSRVLPAIRHLRDLRSLAVHLRGPLEELHQLADVEHLHALSIWDSRLVTDLQVLAQHPELRRLSLVSLPELRALFGVGDLNLEQLDVVKCPITDLDDLDNRQLASLALRDLPLRDIAVLSDLNDLRHLALSALAVDDLTPVAQVPELETLVLTDLFAHMPVDLPLLSLQTLECVRCEIRDVEWLGGSHLLQGLNLTECPVSEGSSVGTSTLTSLHLERLPVANLDGWGGRALRTLTVRDCPELMSLAGLSQASSLTQIELLSCPISEIDELSEHWTLTSLSVAGCSKLKSLEPLTTLPIERLDISGCTGLQDLRPLAGMPALSQLKADGLEDRVASAGMGPLLAGPPIRVS
jgi:hypothetical protein